MTALTNRQARQFLLLLHGLLGEHRFIGAPGALDFVRQAGCIQFDPVNLCGRNAELTLLSRVKGFSRDALEGLRYRDRSLVDYPDKNLSILLTEDWPYFSRLRERARCSGEQFEGLEALKAQALDFLRSHGPCTAEELPIEGRIRWHSGVHWSGNWHGDSAAARSVLEQLYSEGALVIYHREGVRKVYDIAERCLPQALLEAPDPLADEQAHIDWRVCRRIGAVGLLWNRPSDAWLGIDALNAATRAAAFARLEAQGRILPVQVEGIRTPLYCRAEHAALLESVRAGREDSPRCEALAPLDCLLWDRRLIEALFGFAYRWEIYTPADKRRFGAYTLPLLVGERFVGRAEAVACGNVLEVRHIWLEDGVRETKRLRAQLGACMGRLARMNGCRAGELPGMQKSGILP